MGQGLEAKKVLVWLLIRIVLGIVLGHEGVQKNCIESLQCQRQTLEQE